VATNHGDGAITSGIYSPTLGYSIALARLPRRAAGGCTVDIRGKPVPARIVRPPFVRRGRQVFE
jgi:aminomethyltransferase